LIILMSKNDGKSLVLPKKKPPDRSDGFVLFSNVDS
jgi:hypothetical protein